MINKVIQIEKLYSSNRWNAEFFFDKNKAISKSKNYEIMRLGELVCERKEFLIPADYHEHLFNYIGLENISKNTRKLSGFEPKYGKEIKSRCKVFIGGDILYGRLRPTLNKTLLIDDLLSEGICSTEIFVLIPNKKIIDPNYLAEVLISRLILERVGTITAGAALPRMQMKDFLELDIPVPTLKFQKKLADNAMALRKESEGLINRSNEILEGLAKTFVHNIEDGCENIKLDLSNIDKIEEYRNPLPEGDFNTRRRVKV